MKKRKMTYLVMAGALLAASCSSDKEAQEATGTVPISLGYTTEEVQTRANDNLNPTNITTGDAVKVLIKKSSETWGSSTAYATEGYDYTAGDAGALTPPTTAPAYPTDGTSVDMMAYYPADAATTFIVSNDQKDTDEGNVNYKASDLLVASPIVNQFRTSEKVNLQLYHKMAKVVIQLEDGDISLTDVTAVKLVNVKRQVTFTPTTGAISAAVSASGDNPDEIAISASGEGSAAVFPPQTINGTLVEVATTAGTAYYSAINKTFQAGHQYTATIKVNSSAIGLTNAITDWTVEAAESGSTTDPQTLGELTEWINYYGTTNSTKYSGYLGWYVKADGTISTNKADAIGIIAYMSTIDVDTSIPGSRILVLAVSDVGKYAWKNADSSGEDSWNDESKYNGFEFTASHNNSTTYPAAYQAYNLTTSRPSGASSWFLPSKAQWSAMLPVSSTLSLSTTGGYWTATEHSSNNQDAWDYQFATPTWSGGSKTTQHNVRACFAYPNKGIALSAATAKNIGWVIATNGLIYENVSQAAEHGQTACGIIAYVGSETGESSYTHGLAISLKDANAGSNLYMYWGTGTYSNTAVNGDTKQYSTIDAALSAKESGYTISHMSGRNDTSDFPAFYHTLLNDTEIAGIAGPSAPTNSTGWFMPSMFQWNQIVLGLTNKTVNLTTSDNSDYVYTQLNEVITTSGGTGLQNHYYWSTTETSNTYTWGYYAQYGKAYANTRMNGDYVRAVFAF